MKATIEIPDGYTLVKVNGAEYKVVKNDKKLPDTWEEFCEMNPIKNEEAYVSSNGNIIVIEGIIIKSKIRYPEQFCNFLPSKEKAEAILALCQLIQLRDCYNDGWVPDWKNIGENKYVVFPFEDGWIRDRFTGSQRVFAFKSEELRDKFLENFRDLLDKIKPLYQ